MVRSARLCVLKLELQCHFSLVLVQGNEQSGISLKAQEEESRYVSDKPVYVVVVERERER